MQQFRKFVDQTGYRTDAEKHGYSIVYNHYSGRLTNRDDVTWEMNYEGQKAAEDEPVVHVSWNDATAYVQWLGPGYRQSLIVCPRKQSLNTPCVPA